MPISEIIDTKVTQLLKAKTVKELKLFNLLLIHIIREIFVLWSFGDN